MHSGGMQTFSHSVEGSDDGEIWMPEADAQGTEEYDGTAEQYAREVLDNWLSDWHAGDPADHLRVVVCEGDLNNMSAPLATVYGHE